ncbi:MAG TPA: hypothetical protein PKK92_03915, partial [Methanothrix sp.]|nr:hypothetical protein [Methanothrix sp.]
YLSALGESLVINENLLMGIWLAVIAQAYGDRSICKFMQSALWKSLLSRRSRRSIELHVSLLAEDGFAPCMITFAVFGSDR